MIYNLARGTRARSTAIGRAGAQELDPGRGTPAAGPQLDRSEEHHIDTRKPHGR